jgi:hypothetical protein
LALRQHPGHGLDAGGGGNIKVFWFFSSEKNIFLTSSSHLEFILEQPPALARSHAGFT